MKDIWMVIYSQAIRVAKPHLQLPPVESETVGPVHRWPLHGGGTRHGDLTWPQPSTCISKEEKKEKEIYTTDLFPINSIQMEEFQQPAARLTPTQRARQRGKVQAGCLPHRPCLHRLLPCSSSLPAACQEVVIMERRAYRERSNHSL